MKKKDEKPLPACPTGQAGMPMANGRQASNSPLVKGRLNVK